MKEPITLRIQLSGGENSIIPKGFRENLRVDVVDGIAVYKFTDSNTTRKFADGQNADGVDSRYNERIQKTICKYPDMDQKAIVTHITKRIKELSEKKE